MGTYKVWVEDGIIRIILIGTHNQDDAQMIIDEVDELLPDNNKRLILTDMRRIDNRLALLIDHKTTSTPHPRHGSRLVLAPYR